MPARIACFAPLFALLLASGPLLAEDLIPDKKLEAVVRKWVFEKRDNDQPLTKEDLEKISIISMPGLEAGGIKSLQGLEHCHSLLDLQLPNNEISDLSPLKDLKVLQKLVLNKNQIADIGPLTEVKALQHLELEDNQVVAADALAGMSNMQSLYLSNNKIQNLAPLKELKKIQSLYLDGNQVSDLGPLAELPWISVLDLTGNPVADLGPLRKQDELRHLFLNGTKVAEVQVLVEMAKADLEGQRRFAPFWNVYLDPSSLSDAGRKQLDELKQLGVRVHLPEGK